MASNRYVRFFEEFGIGDVPLVGGKNASLGEMYKALSGDGVRVPNGFAITADAYRYVLEDAGAWEPLRAELEGLDPGDVGDLRRRAKRAREIVYGSPLPDDLTGQILDGLQAAAVRVRAGRPPGGAELGDRGGPAERELRRPTRELPEHPRRAEPAGRVPALLCQPVHRPRDPLPHRPGL